MAYILYGCGTVRCAALEQSNYLTGPDSALKTFFFKMLHDLTLTAKVPCWYSLAKPKPVYEWDDILGRAGVCRAGRGKMKLNSPSRQNTRYIPQRFASRYFSHYLPSLRGIVIYYLYMYFLINKQKGSFFLVCS